MHAQQLPVKLTGIYNFNTSITSNGHYARKSQLQECKEFFKSFKNKSTSSLHKQNKPQNKNQGKYCKRTAIMLDEKYTEPNKQQKGVKDVARTKWPFKTIQAAKPFSFGHHVGLRILQ